MGWVGPWVGLGHKNGPMDNSELERHIDGRVICRGFGDSHGYAGYGMGMGIPTGMQGTGWVWGFPRVCRVRDGYGDCDESPWPCGDSMEIFEWM